MNSRTVLIANTLLIILVIIEGIYLTYYKKEKLPWKKLISNLNSGHIVLWIFRGAQLASYYFVLKYFNLGLTNALPYWLKLLFTLFFWDFVFYWNHRTQHNFKLLWAIHVVHHEGEHYSLSLGFRNSWYTSLASTPFFMVLACIGIPLDMFLIVSSLHYLIQFYNHNDVVKNPKWLKHFFITPTLHRIHHGKNNPYIDKNFGGTFVFWDKLFGTFQEEIKQVPVQIGVNNPSKSLNPVLINNIPLLKLFNLKWTESKTLQKKIVVSNFILISSALLLYCFFLIFVYYEKQVDFFLKVFLVSMGLLGVIANGLLSEEKRSGIIIWIFTTVFFPILFFILFPHLPIIITAILCVTMLHGIFTFLNVFYAK